MNPRTTLAIALAAAASLALAGCSTGSADSNGSGDPAKKSEQTQQAAAKPELTVSGGFMPEPATDRMGGGFLTVTNKGAADKLTKITSDISDDIQLHKTVGQKMQHVNALDVPENGTLKLERGGNHVMFMDLKKLPKKGDKIAVELHFAKSDPITTEFTVEDATHNPKMNH
ncbi:copper chaperone PCu(A)C [Streptomyces sp. NPDC002851]